MSCQVLHSDSAPCFVGNRQIHEDFGIVFFANHIRTLAESFDSRLADACHGQPRLSPEQTAKSSRSASLQRQFLFQSPSVASFLVGCVFILLDDVRVVNVNEN